MPDIDPMNESDMTEDDELDILESEYDSDDNLVLSTTLFQYEDPVFVCAFSPTSSLIAMGCQDDNAYILNSETQEMIHIVSSHNDSVTELGFSKNGLFLATGDLCGHIEVTNVDTLEKVWEISVCGDLLWMKWHNYLSYLLAGTSDGEVWLWQLPDGKSKFIHSSGIPTQAAALSVDGKRIVVGYDSGEIRCHDIKQCLVLTNTTISKGSPVTALTFHPNDTIVLAGTEDGCCKLVNCKTGNITFSLDLNTTEPTFVETVDFCPTIPNYAVVVHGVISIYDINHPASKRQEICCDATQIVWHPTLPYLYAACLDGTIKCYDIRNGDCIKQFVGHTDHVLGLAICQNGKLLLSGSDDKTARLFLLDDENV